MAVGQVGETRGAMEAMAVIMSVKEEKAGAGVWGSLEVGAKRDGAEHPTPQMSLVRAEGGGGAAFSPTLALFPAPAEPLPAAAAAPAATVSPKQAAAKAEPLRRPLRRAAAAGAWGDKLGCCCCCCCCAEPWQGKVSPPPPRTCPLLLPPPPLFSPRLPPPTPPPLPPSTALTALCRCSMALPKATV